MFNILSMLSIHLNVAVNNDRNQVINIIDAAVVAKNFGKTASQQ